MNDVLKMFIPHKGYIVTPILIYINIIVFAIMVFSGVDFFQVDGEELIAWGANRSSDTLGGEWWRLITYMFLHGSYIHILGNMVSLFFVGLIIEPIFGSRNLLWMYLLSGIVAGIASMGWHDDIPSVGASGAIFGLFGVALAMIQKKIFPSDFIISFILSIASSLGSGLMMEVAGGGVDNAAHVGGVLCGYLFGLLISTPIAAKRKQEQAAEAAVKQEEQQYAQQLLQVERQRLQAEVEKQKQEEKEKQIVRW